VLNPNFDPLSIMEQLQANQHQLDLNMQNVIMVANQHTKNIHDHETRLDLNQQTINQVLTSLQNQQTLLMAVFDKLQQLEAVNSAKGSQS
jgi:hypothetical protein